MTVDVANKFQVGAYNEAMHIGLWGLRLEDADAINLAAWLVASVDPEGKTFASTLTAVKEVKAASDAAAAELAKASAPPEPTT